MSDFPRCDMCEGTGDLQNHERDSWPCPKCAGGGPAPGPDFVTITRDQLELYKEAAEEWAKDWRRPTQLLRTVRCKSCLSATRIDELRTYHSAMVVHAADCKAARILDLPMETPK